MATPLERLRLLTTEVDEEWPTDKDALSQPLRKPDEAVESAEGRLPPKSSPKSLSAMHLGEAGVSMCHMLKDALPPQDNTKAMRSQAQGEISSHGRYCPILALSKLPYKYMDPKSSVSDFVSKKFFANNLFWKNTWNIYYVHVPTSIAVKPLLLITEDQAQTFIGFIAHQSGIRLAMPAAEGGFIITFDKDGSPLPRYLGMSTCREDFHSLEATVPTARLDFQEHADGNIVANCSKRTFEEWAAKIERAIAATKNKAKASKEKRKSQRVQTKTSWSRQLKRAQRYLGLRSLSSSGSVAEPQLKQDIVGALPADASKIENCVVANAEACATHYFESDVVLLSIDVEAYEHGAKQITEIGIATLDTRDLTKCCPGDGGKNWMEMVKGRHLWIKEYAHLVNKDFVPGCPDRYETCFGKSEMVSTSDAVQILQDCFNNPNLASRQFGSDYLVHPEEKQPSQQTVTPALDSATAEASPESEPYMISRKVVVVGHDISQDINYLNDIKFNLFEKGNVIEILDTSEIYRAMRHEENPPSVSTMLYNLGISGWNLHNAGNDAGYTLQALVGIAVRSMDQGNEKHADANALIEKAKHEAEERVRDNLEEWELASEGEEADGGAPTRPCARVAPKKEKKVRVQAGGIV